MHLGFQAFEDFINLVVFKCNRPDASGPIISESEKSFWISSCGQKGSVNLVWSFCPSVCPFIYLSAHPSLQHFLWISYQFFLKLLVISVKGSYGDVCNSLFFFLWKNPNQEKWLKMVENGPNLGFLDFLGKSIH